jgi:hypothetical protein
MGAGFAPNILEAQKSFWTHPMLLLSDETQVEARFSLFGGSANLEASQEYCLRRTYHRLKNHFGCT